MRVSDALGRYGERLAVQHLESGGFRVVECNWRCARGEVDVIGWDRDVLVFCEVKTRRGGGFGLPAEAVTPVKARRIRALACLWLAERRPAYAELRFDVVSVLVPRDGAPVVEHLPAAF